MRKKNKKITKKTLKRRGNAIFYIRLEDGDKDENEDEDERHEGYEDEEFENLKMKGGGDTIAC